MNDKREEGVIRQRIGLLMNQVEERTPMTRQILAHLSEIETALNAGVRRADLASALGMRPDQFCAALAGARRLARQGGDGRRMRRNGHTKNEGAIHRPVARRDDKRPGDFIKPFGEPHD